MFFAAGSKQKGGGGRGNEKLKKAVTALNPGEDRAILLGLGMILSSVMIVWTEEGVCIVLNSTIAADVDCSYNCGPECWRVSRYPCLQIYVSVNNTGRVSRLSHNEETQDASSECRW
ncbi:hypothetical protein CRUP_033373 [Coryphaenoides rupestris]|nr:hypothetical protein CRUP_033373 [Coryphaenoides rupestris]